MKNYIIGERIGRDLVPGDDILIVSPEGLAMIVGILEVEDILEGKCRMLSMDDGRIRAVKPEARIAMPIVVHVYGRNRTGKGHDVMEKKQTKATAKDGVNYCRCCGGDVKSVGPLNSRGACGDCVAEYSKPEYHMDADDDRLSDETPDAETDE